MTIKQIIAAKELTDVERWSAANSKEKRPVFKKLISILVKEAPESAVVVPRQDDQINEIVTRGRFIPVKGKTKRIKESNQCHANTAAMYQSGTVDNICTGYALAPDGGWRSHTWGIKNAHIVETTYGMYVKYFGVLLNVKESKQFIAENL